MGSVWLLVEIHGRNSMVGRSKLVLIVSPTLNAVQDEQGPGNEFENDRDHKARKTSIVSCVFLRGTIGVIAPALVDVGQVPGGTVRGVGAPRAKERATSNEQYNCPNKKY